MSAYNFRAIEPKWQKTWLEQRAHCAEDETSTKPKFYALEMFPYPSGRIHMGHLRNYAMGDVVARFKRLKGFNVLHPMGWDAFGLPAENAAMQQQAHPQDWTFQNIDVMRGQLQSIGLYYDWSREIATCHPDYYGHQQRLFLDLYGAGLVYQKESYVNWDPVEQTVLANEQVIDGCGWRSGAPVERRLLRQWFLRITDFAEQLLADLKTLDQWPARVLTMQENWIGRSEGARIRFTCSEAPEESIEVFTTRPETLFGASFVAVAVGHPFVRARSSSNPLLAAFVEEAGLTPTTQEAMDTAEKKGCFTGFHVQHPLIEGALLPVYAANFVLTDYGTGALFGCPAHDERDFEFAQKYDLPIRCVVEPLTGEGFDPREQGRPWVDDGLMINSDFLNGLSVAQAKNLMMDWLQEKKIGSREITYRLRDWGVSRQRYWGCPIPVVHCKFCGVVPIPVASLPVQLPRDVHFEGGNPLDRHPTWKATPCPTCGEPAERETDTLDTFFDSSWYFLRFCSPRAKELPFDPKAAEYWMQVDKYIGGIEHAILHLLYARFFCKALKKIGYAVPNEPFAALMTQGMVCHETYKGQDGKWLFPTEVEKNAAGQHVKKSDQSPVMVGRSEKMSKSKKNVVDPDHIISTYGADAARLFVLSDTPPEKDLQWSDEGMEGAWRFLNRVWRFVTAYTEGTSHKKEKNKSKGVPEGVADGETLLAETHRAIRSVEQALDRDHFNVAIARLRTFANLLLEAPLPACSSEVTDFCVRALVMMLYPFCPHMCSELWEKLETAGPLWCESWPKVNEALLPHQNVTLAVQVNGKLKAQLTVSADACQATVEKKALALPEIVKLMQGNYPKKVIVVLGRVVNIVL